MEGNRAIRFQSDWWESEELIDHKNVIFVELSQRLSAIEFGNIIKEYGDVQVIKDGERRYFIEFQWVDDIKYPQCRRAQDICDQLTFDQPFGEYHRIEMHGKSVTTKNMLKCCNYQESLNYRESYANQK